ncbi:MAG: radical SAM protein [Planctomycetota bacterium]|nr:radical SAM protein [Planctomycetota bacterium]
MGLLSRVFGRNGNGRLEEMAIAAAPQEVDLEWVSEWVSRVKDHVFVRREDNVFIKRPNQAFKLNPEGVDLMARLLEGETLESILAPHRGRIEVWRHVERFLLDVRLMLKEGLNDTYESCAVDKIPFEMEFSPYPVLSEVAVTYRCNAACTFCYAGCNCTVNPVGNDDEMTLEQIYRVLDKIRGQAKVPSVSFTGGEATLRPDLPDMVRYARSIGMRVNLITNGMKGTEELTRTLADAGLNSAQVSIEGTTAEVHEGITRIPTGFKRAVAAVHNFKAVGVHVHTNTTITKTNADDAVNMPRFVKEELGLDAFSMNLVIPTGSAVLNEQLSISYVDLGPVLERILEESDKHGVEFKWYSPTPMCIFNPILHGLGNKGCSACDGLISVGADGQVLPCASYDEPVGDLLSRDFEDIWHAPEAKAFRTKSKAHAICQKCEHFHICNGACPLYWRQIGYDELYQVHGIEPEETA